MKRKLDEGKNVLGTFFELGSEEVVESLGYTGLDFIIVDTEHGPYNAESTARFTRAAEVVQLTTLVRVTDISRPSMLRNLDIGAKGLIVPCVETVDEVKKLVEWSKYTPVGKRGYFKARSAGYGEKEFAKDLGEYFQTCNRETLLIPQCETIGCLENIEEIMSIEGVDGIFVGPFDLSIGLGIPAQFDNPKFKAALNRILKAAKDNNKYSFIFSTDAASARKMFELGYQGVAVGMDAGFLISSVKSAVSEIMD
ncbi:HpcH/HpaI aldolase family protein [Gudongella sp. DL1XJH-153]|uniref:HpcH/HpaI aldolase family protein n=1 Tax=Gudongella sp. DL1XJH-153 TaxID=3409804 RepID=UPI003BB661B4